MLLCGHYLRCRPVGGEAVRTHAVHRGAASGARIGSFWAWRSTSTSLPAVRHFESRRSTRSGRLTYALPLQTCCSAILSAALLDFSFPHRAESRSTRRASSSSTCTRLCGTLVISTTSPGSAWPAPKDTTSDALNARTRNRLVVCCSLESARLMRTIPQSLALCPIAAARPVRRSASTLLWLFGPGAQ